MMRLDEAAREWIGVPFLHQGRTTHGIDCIGLIRESFLRLGRVLIDDTTYPRDPYGSLLDIRLRQEFGEPIPKEQIQPCTVASFTWAKATRHVGIIGEFEGRMTIIHTSSSVGRVTEESINDRWLRRLTAVYLTEFK